MLSPPTPGALGESVSLLEPPILSGAGGWRLAAPPSPLLRPLPLADADEGPGAWEAPRLHLCLDDAALLSRVMGVTALPAPGDGDDFDLPPGTLALRGPDAEAWREALAAALGLTRVGPGRVCLCLSVERVAARQVHEGFGSEGTGRFDRDRHLSAEAKRAMARLAGFVPGLGPPDAARRLRDARDSLDFIRTFGSHFVSAHARGDRVLQVFALDGEAASELAARGSGPAEGLAAVAFAAELARLRPEVGRIVSVAGDPRLAGLLAGGVFHDAHQLGVDSLFLPFQRGLGAVREALGPLTAVGTLGLELTPTARALERYRALGVARVTRGALALRFGAALRCAFPRSPLDPDPPPAPKAAGMSVRWSPEGPLPPGLRVVRELALGGPGHSHLGAGEAWWVAERLTGAAHTDELHTISRGEGATLRLAAGSMRGALRLEGPEGAEIVLDGLRIREDAGGVVVHGDVGLPDEGERRALRPGLEAALAAALGPVEVQGARVRHDEALAAWLAGWLPEGEGPLRALLRGIGRGEADAGEDALSLPAAATQGPGRAAGALAAAGGAPEPTLARRQGALRAEALRAVERQVGEALRAARADLDAEVAALRSRTSEEDDALTLDLLALPVEDGPALPLHLQRALRPGGLRPRPPPPWLLARADLPLALLELRRALAPGGSPLPPPRIPPAAFDRHLHHVAQAFGEREGLDAAPLLRALAAWLRPMRALCQVWRARARERLAATRVEILESLLARGEAGALPRALWLWTLAEALAEQNAAMQHDGRPTEPVVPARPLALVHALAHQAQAGG